MSLVSIPKLADPLEHPERASDVPVEAIAGIRGKLAELDTLLLGRMLGSGNGQCHTPTEGDRLLDVEQAAAKLGKSPLTLYKTAGRYPFTVRDGRALRFSEQGIERFIRQRAGALKLFELFCLEK